MVVNTSKRYKKKKNKYIYNFYKIISFLKKNLLFIKYKILKSYNILKNVKKKIKRYKIKNLYKYKKKKDLLVKQLLKVNKIKKVYKKKKKYIKLYNIMRQILNYFNNFLSVLLKKIILKKKKVLNKKFVYESYVLNLVIKEEKMRTIGLSHFFTKKYFYSKKIAMFLFDRLFNRVNVVTMENVNKLYSKSLYEKQKESLKKKNTKEYYYNYVSGVKLDYLTMNVLTLQKRVNLIRIKKKKKKYLYLKLLHFYNYVNIYKKKYLIEKKSNKEIISLVNYNKVKLNYGYNEININKIMDLLVNFYLVINKKIYKKSIENMLYFYIEFYKNVKIKNYLQVNEKVKEIYIKKIKGIIRRKLKEKKIKYMQVRLMQYIHFIINGLFKIIKIIDKVVEYIKKINYGKLTRYLNYLKKKIKLFKYHRFSNKLIFVEY
jgi:hypothetical protein